MLPSTVSIIVPILQQAPILAMFMSSLRATLPPGPQLIFIDDGCNGDAREVIDRACADLSAGFEVVLIRHPTPLGEGRSCNEALGRASGEIVIRLESDAILEGEWVGALCAPFSDRSVSAVAGVLLYPQSGGINHAGLTFYGMVGRHTFLNATIEALPPEPFAVQSMTFGFGAFRGYSVRDAGGFDEHYHQAYDDLDLALRLGQHGQLLVTPAARAYHWELSSGPHRTAAQKRNLAIFWSRWGESITEDLWRYLEAPLRQAVLDAPAAGRDLAGIDLHSDRVSAPRFWEEAQSRCGMAVKDRLELAHRAPGNGPIALPLVLGAEGFDDPRCLIFLVDNFVRLRGNQYFFERRRRNGAEDIIVDFHGNVVKAQRLLPSAWPGEKLR